MAIKASNQISIVDVTDAYSVILTSEAYTFVGGMSGAASGSTCSTQAVAFCGNVQCSKVSVDQTAITCPTGISAAVTNNNTSSVTITFTLSATLSAAAEAIIPVVVDGITVNKKFSFAVAKAGSKGDTGKGILTVTEQFYLSTSDETPTGGSWVDTPPTLTNDTHMWTRSKITYTDNTVSYTEPSCVSSWNNILISNNAPTDTSKLWFNTSDNLFYEYKNGEWGLVIDLYALSNTFDSKIEDAKDYANTIKSAIDKDLADYYYKKTEVKKEVEDGITESLTKWRTIATEEATNGNAAFTKITELESYIKKGVDTSGLPYIELGTGDPTGYSLRIQNNSIAIYQGSSEIPVSEWLSDKFNVATVITSALGIGNFDFIVNDDDSLSFRKVR